MVKPDLTYRTHGLYTRFYPETFAGECVWREFSRDNHGVMAVLTVLLDQMLAALRKADYVVQEGAAPGVAIEAIIKELSSL